MQNLGVALGAYAQEANRQRELARQDEMLAMQKEQFGWQRDEQQEKKDYRSRVGELQREHGTFKQLYADPLKNRAQLEPILSRHGVRIGDDGNYYDTSGKAYAPAQLGAMADTTYLNALYAIGRPEDFAQGLTTARDWNYKLGRDTTVDSREDRKLGQTDRQLDITDNRYTQMLELERQKLALERELGFARIGAMRAAGHGGDGGGMTPQEQAQVQGLWQKYQNAVSSGDEKGAAAAARELELLRSTFAINRGKFPAINSNITRDPRPGAMGYDALGGTGLIQDKATGTLFKQDDKGNLVPVKMPGAVSALDAALKSERDAIAGKQAGLTVVPPPKQTGGHFSAPPNPFAGRNDAGARLRQFDAEHTVGLTSMDPIARTRALVDRAALERELGLSSGVQSQVPFQIPSFR